MNRSFRELYVWRTSIPLAVRMVALADQLSTRRRFAIADQMVRAALSVPANFAEGEGRTSRRDRRHYLVQARGSLYELESHLEAVIQARLGRDASDTRKLIAPIGAGLTHTIERRDAL